MSLQQALLTCLYYKIVNFRDRAPRSEYWWFFLFAFVLQQVIGLFAALPGGLYIMITILLYVGWAQLAVTVRRLHDLNQSGHWLWIAYGPAFVGIALMMYRGALDPKMVEAIEAGTVQEDSLLMLGSLLSFVGLVLSFGVMAYCAKAGTVGANRFGPDPLRSQYNAQARAGQWSQSQSWQQQQQNQQPHDQQAHEQPQPFAHDSQPDDGLDPWAKLLQKQDEKNAAQRGDFGFNANAPENDADDSNANNADKTQHH